MGFKLRKERRTAWGWRGSKDAVDPWTAGCSGVQGLLEPRHFNYPHSEDEELLLRGVKLLDMCEVAREWPS